MSDLKRLTPEELEIELMACFKVPRDLIRDHIAALEAEIPGKGVALEAVACSRCAQTTKPVLCCGYCHKPIDPHTLEVLRVDRLLREARRDWKPRGSDGFGSTDSALATRALDGPQEDAK